MIVYKVVKKADYKDFYRSTRYGINSKLVYKLGEWTRPILEGTAIFTFQSIAFAKIFKTQEEIILECEIGSVVKYTVINLYNYKTFLKLKKKKKKYSHLCYSQRDLVSGTVLVSAVKPLREVQ